MNEIETTETLLIYHYHAGAGKSFHRSALLIRPFESLISRTKEKAKKQLLAVKNAALVGKRG
jgi:hypothetical protein